MGIGMLGGELITSSIGVTLFSLFSISSKLMKDRKTIKFIRQKVELRPAKIMYQICVRIGSDKL